MKVRDCISDRLREKQGENGCGAVLANQAGWPGQDGHPGGTFALDMPQPGPVGCISAAFKCCLSQVTTTDSMRLWKFGSYRGWESTRRSQGTGLTKNQSP